LLLIITNTGGTHMHWPHWAAPTTRALTTDLKEDRPAGRH
jgi:hypothetical protein